MKNSRTLYPLLAITCLSLLAGNGCSPSTNSVSSSSVQSKPLSINWVLALKGSALDKSWDSYEVLSEISSKTKITPTIEIVSENYNQIIMKRLQSGDCPDLLTFKTDDPMVLKMAHISSVRCIDEIPSIVNLIPDKIKAFHSDKSGKLSYIPGGFYRESPNLLVPAEGIYVRSNIYNALGRPVISNTSDLIKVIEAYKNWYMLNVSDILQGYRPIVLEQNGNGIATLEHLFGIHPFDKQIQDPNLKIPDTFKPLQDFLYHLGQVGVDANILDSGVDSLDKRLSNPVLFYIGGSDRIDQYNYQNADNPYIPLWPVFHENGFVKAQSVYGSYSTYICCDDSHLETAVDFIEYLLSDEGSRTAMLGIRNKHWLLSDEGKIVLFPEIQHMMLNNDSAFIQKSGIGLFPYLSPIGASYPGRDAGISIPVIDILPEYKQYTTDPTTENGLVQSRYEKQILQAYKASLSLGF